MGGVNDIRNKFTEADPDAGVSNVTMRYERQEGGGDAEVYEIEFLDADKEMRKIEAKVIPTKDFARGLSKLDMVFKSAKEVIDAVRGKPRAQPQFAIDQQSQIDEAVEAINNGDDKTPTLFF